jgi:hypothetical protein
VKSIKRPSQKKDAVGTPTTCSTTSTAPYLEFVQRVQGTLPEVLTEKDLDTLNSGLKNLFALLREARHQFDHEGDNGRCGAFTALAACWMFVVLFRGPRAETLEVPIVRLQDALVGLENNLVSPIVKPHPRRGRAPSSYAQLTLRGYVAGTVKRLVGTGLDLQGAYKLVAKRLDQLGVRPERGSGRVTATTVRNWCDEVSSDVGRHGAAAQAFDSMFARPEEQQRFSELPSPQARGYALDTLRGWVQAIFPELRKPA